MLSKQDWAACSKTSNQQHTANLSPRFTCTSSPSGYYRCHTTPGPVFYLLSWSPSHFIFCLQVTWQFSIFTPSDLEASHLAKSQVTSVADLEISWVVLSSLFVLCIFLNQYMWHYMICFITYLQKAVRILFIDKLAVRCQRLRQHRRHRGLRWCWFQWRHYRVDAWRHNSVDADAWRRQHRIARKTIGCVPK